MREFIWQLDQSSQESTGFNTTVTKFGDGYEQAVSFGINNSRKVWRACVTNKRAVTDDIYRFLVDTKAVTPFIIRPICDESPIKVCLDGDISRAHLGGDVWRINFDLRQVF